MGRKKSFKGVTVSKVPQIKRVKRTLVLKDEDPDEILKQLEFLSKMEFNIHQPSPLLEEIKNKQAKLKNILITMLNKYSKNDPGKWADLKLKLQRYENHRCQMIASCESAKLSQQPAVSTISQTPSPTEAPKVQHQTSRLPSGEPLLPLGPLGGSSSLSLAIPLPELQPNLSMEILCAASARLQLTDRSDLSKQQSATVSAEPHTRNNKFVPSDFGVKQDDKKTKSSI